MLFLFHNYNFVLGDYYWANNPGTSCNSRCPMSCKQLPNTNIWGGTESFVWCDSTYWFDLYNSGTVGFNDSWYYGP